LFVLLLKTSANNGTYSILPNINGTIFMKAEEILEKLRNCNAKEVARKTEIPYDRMAKWLQGKGLPKQNDYNKLVKYFRGINSTSEIPLVSQEVAAGFGNENFAIKEEDIQARYVVPDFNGIDFMIRVKGSSMYPKYSSGDVIACRILKERNFIQWNKTYVVATKEQGMICKRLLPSKKKDFIQVVSDNKDYPPFDIPEKEITGIALIVGVIRLE